VDYPVRTPEQLGAVIKGFRASQDMTQTALGEKTGLAQNAISEFERNPGKSSIQRLYRILSSLGLEVVLREAPQAPGRTKRSRSAPEW
jgi:HTH-type transcriptional regulator / antitoxin HipB